MTDNQTSGGTSRSIPKACACRECACLLYRSYGSDRCRDCVKGFHRKHWMTPR